MAERAQLKPRPNGNGRAKMGADDWAAAINAEWRKGVPSIVATGRLLIEAKKALGHGKWLSMVGEGPMMHGKLDFEIRIAQMLMRIAEHEVLSNAQNFAHLPPVYTTLHELSAIPADRLQCLIEDGTVHPRLRGAEAKTLRNGHIFVEELPKMLVRLRNFMDQWGGAIDADTLDKLSFNYNRELADSPADFKDHVVPRLVALLDKMQAQWADLPYRGTELTERGGKICLREPREIADPQPEEVAADA